MTSAIQVPQRVNPVFTSWGLKTLAEREPERNLRQQTPNRIWVNSEIELT
jgi:hypothetical protein